MSVQYSLNANRSNRNKIIILVAIFLFPIVLAAYLKFTGWRPAKTMNHGELIQPVIPVNDLEFISISGELFRLSSFQQHWLLVTFGSADCHGSCMNNVYKMRQSHIAQGKHQKRIRRLFISTRGSSVNMKKVFQDYPKMEIAVGPGNAIRKFVRQLNVNNGATEGQLNQIYLIDPLGNYMMVYKADADAGGIRKDLKRLLRVSHIG